MNKMSWQSFYYGIALIALISIAACGGGSDIQVTNSPSVIPPSAPSNVVGIADNQQVALSWDDVAEATSYEVYWSTTPGVTKGTGIKITNIHNTTLLHTGLANGTIYYYIVTAVNNSGASAASAQISAQPDDVLPPPQPSLP